MRDSASPRCLAALFAICGALLIPMRAFGESVLNDRPAPSSAAEIRGPLARSFDEQVREHTLFPHLKRAIAHLPPFFSDAHVNFLARTYYFRDRDGDNDYSEAWAGGGSILAESGWRKETFKIGAEFFTSQPIVAPKNRDGTELLRPEQKGYSIWGQAFAMIKYREHVFTAYRHKLDLPYVNEDFSRMTPRTFEGYTLRGRFTNVPTLGTINYTAGYLTKTKDRNDDRFRSMSEAAGVPGRSNEGMAFGGFLIEFSKGRDIGVINYFVADTINIAFAQGSLLLQLSDEWQLKLRAQFSHQRSVGDDLLPLAPFATWNVIGQAAISYRGAILGVGLSHTDSGGELQNPFGTSPSFLSIMQADFDRARELGWILTLTYDFAGIGAPGLSAFMNYAEGYRAIEPNSGKRLPDRREFDLTFDYRLTEGTFRGFWLRVRASVLDVDGERMTNNQVRVILNYDIPIL